MSLPVYLLSQSSRLRRRPFASSSFLWQQQQFPCQTQQQQRQRQQQTVRYVWSVHSDTGIVSYQNKPRFQTIIGLEIHAQLDVPTKLFSPARVAATTAAPNTLVHPFDAAVPGVLPVTSQSAVRAAVLTAAALQCEIAPVSRFERKHYHYADLPFGYQVTQQRWPIARNGRIVPQPSQSASNNKKKKKKKSNVDKTTPTPSLVVGIDRIQLEQDTGKTTTSIGIASDGTATTRSLVDFNRAGCSLVEIVMHPDIRSSKQAAETVETLRQLLKHIGTCNGRMEEGSLRVDLNVSIHSLEDEVEFTANLNNRVEVKNLNSLRQVQQAAEYEAVRQAKIVSAEDGDEHDEHETTASSSSRKTFKETRTFHVKSGKTVLIRSKEGDEDYRFMPEPDLPPVVLNEVLEGLSLQDFLKRNLPELPEAARERLKEDYQLDQYTATVIAGDPPAIRLYDDAVQAAKDNLPDSSWKDVPNAVANLLCNELFSLIREEEERKREMKGHDDNDNMKDVPYSTVNGKQLGEVVALQMEGTISTTMSRKLVGLLYHKEHGRQPSEVAEDHGLQLISNAKALRDICREIIEQNPESLEQYQKGGKHVVKMKKFLVGKAMAQSRGNAHPERLHESLEELLEELAPGVE